MMNRDDLNGTGSPRPRTLLGHAAVVLRHWRLILAITLCTMATAAVVQLLRPPVYTARAVLVLAPSQSDTRPAGLSAGQGAGAAMAGLMLGGSSNQKLVTAVLASRTLAEAVQKRAGAVETRSANYNNVDASIQVLIRDRDPVRAARVANAYGPVLNERMSEISVQSTRLRQQFLRTQMAQARTRLEEAENRMVAFQRRSNTVDLKEQATRTVGAAVDLQRGIAEQEIVVQQLQRTSTPDNPRLRTAIAELEARRSQLRRLAAGGSGNQVFVPLGQGAELQAASVRLMREFTEAQGIYASLAGMLAQAQMEGSSTLPVVNVLDPAVVPLKQSGPSLPVVVGIAAFAGLFLGLVIVFAREAIRSARSVPENREFFEVLGQNRPSRALAGRS
jgi:tyrosine-protein kinase Etk/Wzc